MLPLEEQVTLNGWIAGKRHHGKVLFLEVADSTGRIQVVLEKNSNPTAFAEARQTANESAVSITGYLKGSSKYREILAVQYKVISTANKQVCPSPRRIFDIQASRQTDNLLQNRHLYMRNPSVMAILRFRDLVLYTTRQWFFNNRFVEVTAPILTRMPLYDDGTAISLNVHDEQVYLTQCVGFYLEAAVHGLERVYNIGPSFRGEESRSKRHLMEYWHIKAEMAWGNRDDIISLVERFIHDVTGDVRQMATEVSHTLGTKPIHDTINPPFPRISYRDAVSLLTGLGYPITFGTSLGSEEEAVLSKNYSTPFWIVGIPRKIEPFPYVIDPDDHEVTMTADLIASGGYGELLGVAEKISDPVMLMERMKEKGKWDNPNYEWLKDLRDFGCVPHIGFGMGVERYMRWVLGATHVRDMIPFPRIFGRQIYP